MMADRFVVKLSCPDGLLESSVKVEVGGVDLTKLLNISEIKFIADASRADPVLVITCTNSLEVVGKARVQLDQLAEIGARETELLEMERREKQS